jgi:hypothetical protein
MHAEYVADSKAPAVGQTVSTVASAKVDTEVAGVGEENLRGKEKAPGKMLAAFNISIRHT